MCNPANKFKYLTNVRLFSKDNHMEFNEIPGPKSLPFIGTLYKYIPFLGPYKFDRLHMNGLAKYRQYGPVVREDIVPGVSLLWIFKPEDIETLYRNEGRYPERRSHLALQKYRLDKPNVYSTGGLLPTNGPDWWKIRKAFQKHLSKVKCVRQYISSSDTVVNQFIEQRMRSKKDIKDFTPELLRLFLELTYFIAFDERLQGFNDNEWKTNSDSSNLINAAQKINSAILKTDNGPQLWKKFDTPMYNNIKKGHEYIEKIALRVIKKKLSNSSRETSESKVNVSLLDEYLRSDETNVKDVVGMTVDILLAGIDTVTYSCCFALYHLANNLNAQNQMYEEVCSLLPNFNTKITEEIIERAIFTKAVIKETFRLNPISVGVGRILPVECVFSGYKVPPGTVVVTQNQVTCRMEEYFYKPNTFLPNRWIKDKIEYTPVSPFLVLPFGHGPRTCIARRLAEQFLQIVLIKIVRNFALTWIGPSLDSKSLLINKPDGPIQLRLQTRST